MAVGISQSEWNKYKFPRFARLHFLIKAFPIRLKIRIALLKLNKSKIQKDVANINLQQVSASSSSHFREHGWAFIENVFSDETHKNLVSQWPSFYHFNPVKNIYKSYDTNFINRSQTLQQYPMILSLDNYLQSSELLQWLANFTDDAKSLSIGDAVFSQASYQSSCINHLDSVSTIEKMKDRAINVIFFINGSGGSRSGGTSIYRNAEGDLIFEPINLSNTCLIYRSGFIYHGFQPMRLGSFRWIVSCHASVGLSN